MSSKKNAVDVSTVETGTSMVARGDEADLARMGYKQELKCVGLFTAHAIPSDDECIV